jgi:hypothetical protein
LEVALAIFKKIVAYLPQLFNWWLYSSERTKKNIDVTIHNTDGSVEFLCDELNAFFRITIEFKNNNPFSVEIDRIEIRGWIPYAVNNGVISRIVVVRAVELMGGRIKNNQKMNFSLMGDIDKSNLIVLNQAPDDAILYLHIKAVIKNKYYCIRDFSTDINRLMCKFINKSKNIQQ